MPSLNIPTTKRRLSINKYDKPKTPLISLLVNIVSGLSIGYAKRPNKVFIVIELKNKNNIISK